jgi:iron complex transport system ATP-binding protein
LIKAENITFSYSDRPVLTDVGVSVAEGDLVGLIGPNGAGKSTLLKILSGYLQPGQGQVTIEDRDIHSMPTKEIARTIAVVPQDTTIIFPYRVNEVVLMGRYAHSMGSFFDTSTDVEYARQALQQIDALEFGERYYNQLSGGEQQLVIIARALAQQTPILLLDEPAAALDLKHQVFMARLLTRLATEESKTILVTGHNINHIAGFCKTVLVMKNGRIVARGAPLEVITHELISEVYETSVEILHDNAGNPIVVLSS